MTPRNSRKLGLCFVLSSAMLLSSLRPALADRKTDAAAAADRGDRAVSKGEYGDALTEFRASYEKYPKPYLLFRIAQCEDKLGHDADALADYKKYLDKVSHGADRKKAQAAVAVLQPKVDAEIAAAHPAPPPPPPQPVVQANDAEAPPLDDKAVAAAKSRKITEPSETTASAPKTELLPPGFDATAPLPPEPSVRQERLPPGETLPVYKRWWPWVTLAAGVAVGVGLGLGLGLGLPHFHSELPVGGPGAARFISVRF